MLNKVTISVMLMIMGLVGAANAATLTANPTSISFGSKTINTTSHQTLTVTNSSTSSYQLSVYVGGSAAFSISGWSGTTTLAAGASKSVTVNFAPTAAASYTGVVKWSTSTGTTVSVPLTGSGTTSTAAVGIQISPTSATVALGKSAQFSAVVSGTTNTAVNWYVNGFSGGSAILGTISSTGLYTAPSTMPTNSGITVTAQSRADTSKTSTAAVTLTTASTSGGTSATSFYGSGINADQLSNQAIGPGGYYTSYRFRAVTSSTISGVRLYVKTGPNGYSAGTGGTWLIRLETDDNTSNHFPSGQVLASAKLGNLFNVGALPLISFSSPATVTAGQLYHVVVSNIDSSPNSNYVSINDLVTFSHPVPAQPTISNTDWSMLLNTGSWKVSAGQTPIMEVNYGNGAAQGQGYVDSWQGAPKTISGSSTVRELFTVSGSNRTASTLSLRLQRASGSSNLTVTLADSAGNVIERDSIPASSYGTGSANWATVTFSSKRTLTAGQAYQIILSTPSDTSYTTWGIQKGANYGFHRMTYFPDGYAQYNTGSGWIGMFGSGRTDADIQFFFGVQ